MELNFKDLEVLFSEEQINMRVKEVAQELNKFYKKEEVTAICLLKGGVIFSADLVRYLDMPLKMEFVKLSSYGSSTETSGEIKAIDLELPDLNNKHVLIMEDIVDSGLTAKFILDYIKNNFNTRTLKFCSLLNKKSRRKVDVSPDIYCFDIDDRFVVGYGLDYAGYFRNLPYVAAKIM